MTSGNHDIRLIAEAEAYKVVPPGNWSCGPNLLLYTERYGWRIGCWNIERAATRNSRHNQPTHFVELPRHPGGGDDGAA